MDTLDKTRIKLVKLKNNVHFTECQFLNRGHQFACMRVNYHTVFSVLQIFFAEHVP